MHPEIKAQLERQGAALACNQGNGDIPSDAPGVCETSVKKFLRIGY